MKTKINTLIPLAGLCLALLTVVGVAADSDAPLSEIVLPAPVYPQRDFSKASSWEVVRVIGPDRLIIKDAGKQRTVKLLGVAEPQTEWPKDVPAANHIQAVEFLGNLLSGEGVFVLEAQRNTAAEGELAAVKLFRAPDGLYVNLELIRQGYAQLAPEDLGDELSLFKTYQQRARLSGKGLWSKSLTLVPPAKEKNQANVYVTKAGKRYHRQDCQFLAKSKIAINLGEAKARGFTPCRICKPPE